MRSDLVAPNHVEAVSSVRACELYRKVRVRSVGRLDGSGRYNVSDHYSSSFDKMEL